MHDVLPLQCELQRPRPFSKTRIAPKPLVQRIHIHIRRTARLVLRTLPLSFMKTYAIHWKSSVTGTSGTGTKLFEKEEAERLATELNEDYPDISHEAVPAAAEPANSGPA